MTMKVIFMGTDEFGIPALTRLAERLDVGMMTVVTQPDRPKKRNPEPTPTPIKETATSLGIPVFQPEKLKDEDSISYIKQFKPDLIITASYGQIVPKEILDLPSIASINIHASLLPKYRGAAPIQRVIMDGEKKTGVTLMHMDVGLDTGDIIESVMVDILDTDTGGTLYDKLSMAGAELLLKHLDSIKNRTANRISQQHEHSTYAKMIQKEDEKINWNHSNQKVNDHIRALNPKPGAYTLFRGQILKIWSSSCKTENEAPEQPPGTILNVTKEGIEVACKRGLLTILELQLAGKKKMSAVSFANRQKNLVGTILEGGVS